MFLFDFISQCLFWPLWDFRLINITILPQAFTSLAGGSLSTLPTGDRLLACAVSAKMMPYGNTLFDADKA